MGREWVGWTLLRGNPWVRNVSWIQRPKPKSALRAPPGADDERFWSPHAAAYCMTRRAVSAALASRLADSFEHLDLRWRRTEMADAFAAVLEPARAEELADRVIALMPTEPIDRQASLRALLSELPVLPRIVIPLEPTTGELRFGVPELPDLGALAMMLNVTPAELDWFADSGGWLRRAREPLCHYRNRRLPKSGGVRLLEAPKPRLREIQRTIVRRILTSVPAHPACHGFEKGCSAATFAAPHARADVVVRVDLRNFFSSIGIGRVRAVFGAVGFDRSIANVLGHICTTATAVEALRGIDVHHATLLRMPHLAQGAPSSPRLANLVARNLDLRIAGYARRNGLVYTRYADDLALSGPSGTDVDALLWTVTAIVEDEGFAVHRPKTLIRRSHQRQLLAGLVVNSRPTVPRSVYDDLRALLHNCRETGAAMQNRDGHIDFRAHVYGRIAWVGETNAARRQRLLTMAEQVDWT